MARTALLPLAALLTVATLAAPSCQRSETAGSAPVEEDARTGDDAGYFTVPEQKRIEAAAKALWTGVDPRQNWDDAVPRIFAACAGSLRMDEAFTIARYHPRTTYDFAWRGPVEALLMQKSRWGWDPSSGPRCKLIREAVAGGTASVAEAEPPMTPQPPPTATVAQPTEAPR